MANKHILEHNTATIISNVYQQKKLPNHVYTQHPKPFSWPRHSAHKKSAPNSISGQQQQLQINVTPQITVVPRVRHSDKLNSKCTYSETSSGHATLGSSRVPFEYAHIGKCACVCHHYGATFWECEKHVKSSFTRQPEYTKCCHSSAPKFLQLYIYDTTNEVKNRMAHFGGEYEGGLKKEIVEGLIEFLDTHSALVHLFHTARDKCMEAAIPEFKVKLYDVIGTRQYDFGLKTQAQHCLGFHAEKVE
nr:hypothetical protein [Tanacetum cinerariifolium]